MNHPVVQHQFGRGFWFESKYLMLSIYYIPVLQIPSLIDNKSKLKRLNFPVIYPHATIQNNNYVLYQCCPNTPMPDNFTNLNTFQSSASPSPPPLTHALFTYCPNFLNPQPHIQARLSSASEQMSMIVHPTQAQQAAVVAEVTYFE